MHTRWIAGRPSTRTPAHLWIQVEQLVWQVCDQQAWRQIGDAWFQAQRYLHGQGQLSTTCGPAPHRIPGRVQPQ